MDRKIQRNSHTKEQRMRQQLAQEAARLIAEEGVQDFNTAKQKAAIRLHTPQTHNLPRNDEIQQALLEYQRIFQSETQPRTLLQLRQTALMAMAFFKKFNPKLAGPVADGTANQFSAITLHLVADSSEELLLFLINQHIPYELIDQRFRMANEQLTELPVYRMELEGSEIELIVFDHKGARQAPRDPVTHKPMQRLATERLEELIRLTESAPQNI